MYEYKVVAWVDLLKDLLRKSGRGVGWFKEGYLKFLKN